MRNKEIDVCPRCRGRMALVDFKEQEATPLMHRKCEFCGKKYTGKRYLATDAWLKPDSRW